MNEIQLQDIKKLLKDVGEKIEKAKEIARLKGENFNIFSILGIETKENKTHSSFLASLLNPKGDHGLGDTFLKLFYETILTNEIGIDLTDDKRQIVEYLKQEIVDVKTEVSLGKTNYDEVEGGRVDISLHGNNGKIFIENKIYAGDQHLQIARYVNDQKAVVFYLTLFGDEPSEGSSGKYKVNEHFFLLSYKTDIKNWLEKCQKEASDYPIIRETIKQYLILIKKLTGQLSSNEMEKEIIKSILLNNSNYEAAQSIISLRDKVEHESFTNLIEKLYILFKTHNIIISRNRSKRDDGFFIPIIEYGKYDIGINVELRNNYFFYCAVEKEKVRIPGINSRMEFNDISNYLIKSLNKSGIKATRFGFALAGKFIFNHKFNNNLKFSNNTDDFCTSFVNQIIENINHSKIKEFIKIE